MLKGVGALLVPLPLLEVVVVLIEELLFVVVDELG